MKNAAEKLSSLTSKKHIFFTDRGNSSIKLSLKLAKHLGKNKVVLQDQGGWITYSQYAKELKFEIINLETDFGIILPDTLRKHLDSQTLLLINSMPGYYCLQKDFGTIYSLCKKSGALLINDASASIGRDEARHGDIILGSFGEWKPIEVKYGGFLAFDEEENLKFFEKNFKRERKEFFDELNKRLDELPKRLDDLDFECEKIKHQLRNFDILHRESKGLNVIVRFHSEDEKLRILDFCKVYGYEFTLCPRYIRVLEDAISIEVKRKQVI